MATSGFSKYQTPISIRSAIKSARRRSDRIVGVRKPDWKYWPADTELPEYSSLAPLFDVSSHPELDDQALLKWGLKQSEKLQGWRATVDVLYGQGTDLQWLMGADDKELERIISGAPQAKKPSANVADGDSQTSFQAFFINTFSPTPDANTGWLPGNFSIRPSTIELLRKAGLSSTLLCGIFASEGYWAKMGNQCFLFHDDKGSLSSFEITYRYVCGWDTGVGLTQYIRRRCQRTYFCINYPSRALERLKAYVHQSSNLAYREFFLDALAADDSLKEWQLNIGERREYLVYHEKNYEDGDIDFDKATRELHRLARDWHTLQQDCIDLHAQLEFLLQSHDKYMTNLQKHGWQADRATNTGESLEVLKSQCDNYARWTVVYRDRTNIRINLLFHLVNQRESRTNTSIASSTATVAEQTQRDSASMITIAAVTMFFLPGTFISAILSTTFFDYGSSGLSVSKQWWVLPATTIPLMIVVFGVWLGWQRMRLRKLQPVAKAI